MVRYLSEDAAAQDGYQIVHESERQRFVLTRNAQSCGEAHYSLHEDTAINFDHTVVDPALRGTGLAALLAHRAVTDEVVRGRNVLASCWYIEGYLAKHPELLNNQH